VPDGVAHADNFLQLQLTEGSTKVRIETLKVVQQELGDHGKVMRNRPTRLRY
jgi:hypothetical protein